MSETEFVRYVQRAAGLETESRAEHVAEATLSEFDRRISRGEADDLASYLDGDAGDWLREAAPGDPDTISDDEFVGSPTDRAAITDDVAREYVDDVTATLAEVVPQRELERMVA